MPTIQFKGLSISCQVGENLREVLMRNGHSPHNRNSKTINCKGLGSCGTCSLKISGSVNPPTSMETWRLQIPPFKTDTLHSGVRLACQVIINSDLKVSKGTGFWGENF